MMHNTYMFIFFRILNVVAFFGLIAVLFKKKMLPGIQEQIRAKKNAFHDLEQQQENLKNQQRNLANAIEHQEAHMMNLQRKIALWTTTTTNKQSQADALQQKIQQDMLKKISQQMHAQEIIKLNKKVAGQALENVTQFLDQQFSDKAKNAAFVHAIITSLPESNV